MTINCETIPRTSRIRDKVNRRSPVIPREGRMTKWKGMVASIAPVGDAAFRSVVFAVVVPVLVGTGLSIASGTPAMAVNECGTVVAGGTVICNGDGTPATDSSPYANGIFYFTQDTRLIIDGTSGALTVQPATAVISVANRGGGGVGTREIQINGDVTIITQADATATPISGVQSYQQQGGDALVVQNAGSIISLGNGAFGAVVRTDGTGNATAIQNGGSISTNGTGGSGVALFAETYGSGNAVATQNGGTVTTDGSHAVYALARGSGNATATQTGGTITALSTTFVNGGIVAQTLGVGDARATQSGGTIVTNGQGAAGVSVASGNGDAIAEQFGGTVTSNGNNASGIGAVTNGTGNAIVIQGPGGSATATGVNSNGIVAFARGTGLYMVSAAGSVTGGSGTDAAAVHTSGAAGGTIDIASSAILDGSRSGIAILDESGAVIVTTSGALTGDILTNGGNDTINLIGGSVAGKIDSGADDDTFVWTGGTLTGGFYGGNGSDSAVVSAAEYNGSQMLDGGDDVSAADGWVDSLTLSGATVTAPGANIVNWETVRLDAANLSISDASLTVGSDPGMGLFLTNASTLDGLDAFALTGNMDIDGTSTFTATGSGAGVYSVSGDLANAGIITMQDGVPGDVLTVGGNYTGNGGTLVLDTYLGTDGSASDLLHVAGDTSGTSLLKVVNAGGPGAQTTSDGIRVVQIDGASNGSFSLLGDYVLEGQQVVIGGAYGYALYKNGVVDPADGDWYLRSQLLPVDPVDPVVPIYQPGVPLYEAYPQALLALNGLPTLQQRVGNRYWKEVLPREPQTVFCKDPAQNFKCAVTDEQAGYYEDNGSRSVIEGNGIWGRIEGAHGRFEPAFTTSGTNYDYNLFKLQAGLDGLLSESESGKLIGGITVHYGSANTDVRSFYGTGSIDTQGYGLGANLTWYGTNGFYIDAQGQATWYDSDLYSDTLRQAMANGNNGFGYALSLEAGKRIDLSDGWVVTPQAQLVYSSIDFRSFSDPFGARVSLDDGDSLRGRLGLAVERQAIWKDEAGETRRLNVYGIANLYNEFLDGTQVDVSGDKFESRNDRLWGGIGIGGSYNWADDKYSIYGEVSTNTSLKNFADSYTLGGTVGFRMKW